MFAKVGLCKHDANKKFPNRINISIEEKFIFKYDTNGWHLAIKVAAGQNQIRNCQQDFRHLIGS